MLNGKTFLAVIPARGGSKRLPRKNVLDLAGKPLIAWTIEAAKQSKYIDHFLVSTDDEEIKTVSEQYGAEVLIRPGELATDTASSVDVVLQAIDAQNKQYHYVILLQPTSPLRTAQHIDEAIELLFEKNANAVISVCETDHSPLWTNTLPDDGNMDDFIREEVKGKRSQDLPTYYRLNGAVYIAKPQSVIKEKSFYPEKTYSYVMGKSLSIDVDDEYDFVSAESIIEKKTL
ncbi:MAG: CMP-N-acetlyneuraminic acid synthetase [Shewanella sp. CG18_big_fil_WC_8_21_14_2_50_42_11]|uniref:acylneuraminate cytidylyltransferase family protein n=1 Tax=Shewanella sp. CG18_big_fil_WC_8_21_14_2_50_42_11 TaxID=1975538 RepID=UPI000C6476C7|nr:acylneuraminate cytidylyltransferase family protein [Shewanella sp. CG18_big_fil_WC_8_21_14_2_50_42_11]PIP98568.1 MAG: CMP-N-acetlyneuraminic acid synthetase [Shewanella sp. CG18_big_fil_WC_8_21_14_2_50_42_11]